MLDFSASAPPRFFRLTFPACSSTKLKGKRKERGKEKGCSVYKLLRALRAFSNSSRGLFQSREQLLRVWNCLRELAKIYDFYYPFTGIYIYIWSVFSLCFSENQCPRGLLNNGPPFSSRLCWQRHGKELTVSHFVVSWGKGKCKESKI